VRKGKGKKERRILIEKRGGMECTQKKSEHEEYFVVIGSNKGDYEKKQYKCFRRGKQQKKTSCAIEERLTLKIDSAATWKGYSNQRLHWFRGGEKGSIKEKRKREKRDFLETTPPLGKLKKN